VFNRTQAFSSPFVFRPATGPRSRQQGNPAASLLLGRPVPALVVLPPPEVVHTGTFPGVPANRGDGVEPQAGFRSAQFRPCISSRWNNTYCVPRCTKSTISASFVPRVFQGHFLVRLSRYLSRSWCALINWLNRPVRLSRLSLAPPFRIPTCRVYCLVVQPQ